MIRVARACLLVLALGVSACANKLPLPYAPTIAVIPSGGPATVASVTTVDGRHEDDPTWFGAIRGGYGNPLKTLNSERPLNQVMTQAFHDALAARGMLAPDGAGSVNVEVTIREFEGDQLLRRTAVVKLAVFVRARADGRVLFQGDVGKNTDDGSFMSLSSGIFGSVDDLNKVVLAAMNGAIDDVIANPNFVAALRGVSTPAASRG